MIRNFGVRNYFCFKEGIDISFELGGNVPLDKTKFFDANTLLGIKGANGAGKTNIIKAINFIKLFSTLSAQVTTDVNGIPIISHFRNEEDSDFYIEFDNKGILYRYEVSLNSERVIREALYKKKQRTTILIERVNDDLIQLHSKFDELKNIKLKSDASLISIYKNYSFHAEMQELDIFYDTLSSIKSNTGLTGYRNIEEQVNISSLSERYKNNVIFFNFVKKIIRKADESVHDIEIHERLNDEGNKEFYPLFIHKHGNDLNPVPITFESSGTKALYSMLKLYWETITSGSLLCIDEFDIHLHALILPELINLFEDPDLNKNKAQFIFTAHNTEVIDLLGKYRAILVNKEDGESYCYRLDEIPGSLVRNGRAISPLYLQGKIGGVPNKDG